MRTYDRFFETEILTADPLSLVRLLYRGAIDSVASAKQHLMAGRIADRGRQIAKAQAILDELTRALDPAAGGEIARNLRELYDYMQRQLNQANINQQAGPLIEVESLLRELLTSWSEISKQPTAQPMKEYVPLSMAG